MFLCGDGARLRRPPLKKEVFADFGDPARPYLGLATSLHEEHSYEARLEWAIPAQLRGTLYRNGPGLFDRGGFRKRNLLDGDGMVQSFRFYDGAALPDRSGGWNDSGGDAGRRGLRMAAGEPKCIAVSVTVFGYLSEDTGAGGIDTGAENAGKTAPIPALRQLFLL